MAHAFWAAIYGSCLPDAIYGSCFPIGLCMVPAIIDPFSAEFICEFLVTLHNVYKFSLLPRALMLTSVAMTLARKQRWRLA